MIHPIQLLPGRTLSGENRSQVKIIVNPFVLSLATPRKLADSVHNSLRLAQLSYINVKDCHRPEDQPMFPRLLLGCVLGLALVTFAPGANAGDHPKKERDDNKTECKQGRIAVLERRCDGEDDRIEDDDEVSRRRRHR